MLRRSLLLCGLLFWAIAGFAQNVPRPGPKDLCPVCGMLVSKYPNWVAVVVWKDGHAHFFDGAKDMFKFLHDLPKFAASAARWPARSSATDGWSSHDHHRDELHLLARTGGAGRRLPRIQGRAAPRKRRFIR